MIAHCFMLKAHIADIAGISNHDLQLLKNWARQWLASFNPLKTETVVFTLKSQVSFCNLFLIIFK